MSNLNKLSDDLIVKTEEYSKKRFKKHQDRKRDRIKKVRTNVKKASTIKKPKIYIDLDLEDIKETQVPDHTDPSNSWECLGKWDYKSCLVLSMVPFTVTR